MNIVVICNNHNGCVPCVASECKGLIVSSLDTPVHRRDTLSRGEAVEEAEDTRNKSHTHCGASLEGPESCPSSTCVFGYKRQQ